MRSQKQGYINHGADGPTAQVSPPGYATKLLFLLTISPLLYVHQKNQFSFTEQNN